MHTQDIFHFSHQNKLFLLSEPVHTRNDFPTATAAPVCHNEEIDASTGRDIGEAAGIGRCQRLNRHVDSPPVVEDSLRARGQDQEETTK